MPTTPSSGGRKALNGHIRTPVIRVVVGGVMSASVGVQKMVYTKPGFVFTHFPGRSSFSSKRDSGAIPSFTGSASGGRGERKRDVES